MRTLEGSGRWIGKSAAEELEMPMQAADLEEEAMPMEYMPPEETSRRQRARDQEAAEQREAKARALAPL